MARWKLEVSEETDRTVRAHLTEHGLEPGDLAGFVEEAVLERLYRLTIAEVLARNAEVPGDELERLIEEAIRAAREKD